MSWFRVCDSWWRHRKQRGTSLASRGLWATMGSWSRDQGTDGVIEWQDLVQACPAERPATLRKCAAELVERGWWHAAGSDRWLFHDWADYQPAAASDADRRAADAARKRGARMPVPP